MPTDTNSSTASPNCSTGSGRPCSPNDSPRPSVTTPATSTATNAPTNAPTNATTNATTSTNPSPLANLLTRRPSEPTASDPLGRLQAEAATQAAADARTAPTAATLLADRDWLAANLTAALTHLHPGTFRNQLRIDARDPTPLGRRAEPFQVRDFAALDPAWQTLAGCLTSATTPTRTIPQTTASNCLANSSPTTSDATRGSTPAAATPPKRPASPHRGPRRFWIERPRGHSKTTDTAAMLLWMLATCPHRVRGVAAAADRDQARLNPTLAAAVSIAKDHASNATTGSRVEVISSDAASSYGTIADFILCDELSHWPQPGLWHSLYTAAAKQPHTVLAVLTNAGTGRGWQWEARETARRSHEEAQKNNADGLPQASGGWHFSTLRQPEASWIDRDFLDEQRRALPDPVYRRLWLNQWQHRSGGFLRPDEVRRCRDERLAPQTAGQPGRVYVAAVDYAEKHDRTAAIVCHLDWPEGVAVAGTQPLLPVRPRVVVDRLDVVAPQPDAPVPIAWVDDWIARTAAAFPGVRFVVDGHQLVGTVQRFAAAVPITRFPFAGGFGNDRLARHLRSLILSGDLAWYPGCGRITERPGHEGTIADDDRRDDLETELCELVVVERSGGRVRFDHPSGGHDDRAFVLAVACSELLVQNRLVDEPFEVTPLDLTQTFLSGVL